jgi:hypothetical protein
MKIFLIIIAILSLIYVVPIIFDNQKEEKEEKENQSLKDIIDLDLIDYRQDDYKQDDRVNTTKRLYTAKEIFQLDNLEIFARTLYGEGRNLPTDQIEKIGWVIRNRVNNNGIENYPDSYGEVCLEKYQFSCWNSLYLNELTDNQKEVRQNVLSDQVSYNNCLIIAKKVMNASEIENPLKNVQHYVLNTDQVKISGDKIIDSPYASWTKNLKIVDNDGKGSHLFLG